MASFIGSIDLRETRVPFVIPLAVTSALEIAQLFLGADPFVVLLSMAGILVTFLPLCINGRDLYSICAMVFGLRYFGAALILKTLYLQPLQSHLFAPLISHFGVFLILVTATATILLVRSLDRGIDTFAFPNDPSSLRRLSICCFCVGALFLGLSANSSSGAAGTGNGVGAIGIAASALQYLLILAFVAEASRSLEVTDGRSLFSPFLIGMMFITFVAVSALNARGFFLNCLIGVVLVGFIYKAINWKYVVFGLIFIALFTNFITPVILYTRAQKGMALTQFVQFSLETGYKAATNPSFLKYVKSIEDASSQNINDVEYDYYGDRSNIGNRLSFIGLFDTVYQANQGTVPLGFKSFLQSLRGVAPGFLGLPKNPESLGDWLGWEVGLVPPGMQPFINFGLPMEGYTSWGWIGVIAYQFIFLFLLLFIFSKIASFRLVVPVSIFVFSAVQTSMIETTSDGLLNLMTRNTVILTSFFIVLHFLFFRGRVRTDVTPASAPT